VRRPLRELRRRSLPALRLSVVVGTISCNTPPRLCNVIATRTRTCDAGIFPARYGRVSISDGLFTPRNDFGLTAAGLTCNVGTTGCFVGSFDQTAEPYWEHGVSIQYLWSNIGQVTLGVNNLFNQDPPSIAAFPNQSVPTRLGNFLGNGPYDYRGRSVFLNITRTFK